MPLQPVIDAFESLTRDSLDELARHYAADAWFKDPFNEVTGAAAIRRIFEHMFEQVDSPRFKVTEHLLQDRGAALFWEFHFAFRRPLPAQPRCIRGCSHLRLNDQGLITHHRDYWDTAEELYAQLPLIGGVMRALRRRGATPL